MTFVENGKIQLTMQISFISSLDTGKIHAMDWKSDNVEITMGNEADDIIKELFESFKKRYQKGLEQKWKEVNLFLKVLIYCIIVFIK